MLFLLKDALVHQKNSLVSILVKQAQHFAWVYVIMVVVAICLLMEKKCLSLNATIKMLTFQQNFVWELFLMDLVLLSIFKSKCVWFLSR